MMQTTAGYSFSQHLFSNIKTLHNTFSILLYSTLQVQNIYTDTIYHVLSLYETT